MTVPESDTADLDPADLAALLDAVHGSAARLGATLDSLTDARAREPALLPGWGRGHVITHLARSADVYRWLLTLARTGVEPGPRADGPALERALREGAGRAAADLVRDVRVSTGAMLAEAAMLPAERWSTMVSALAGWRHPAWFTLHRARRELETHHVDLDLGYTPADWPVDYVAWGLDATVATMTTRTVGLARVEATDLGRVWILAPTGATVTGTGHALLAWLAGRAGPSALRSDGPLPTPPPWPLPPYPAWP
ncbi:maleylpyruvate isomerase family mycothiol-dependent enzyme [Streptacidiphilus rugosus]|uniref:maleylpyruvate isomerase family mycothiol-dependent enzyme n=1 Tax=Streptacidiphilus rugosus TaxID=405783 RepID=UPI000B127364|nr:maleylpyruvate isomerase family mycothiol-dependent enzyme [Streptacidiphilus rugosus]